MKVCLHNSNTIEYLQKANEIKVPYYDHKALSDYFEKYPNADIILDLNIIYGFDETDEQAWDEIRINQVLSQGHLICCVESLKQINKCKELNLKFYYGYPINSFYELHSLVDLGVCYVRLAPPLSHQLEEVSKFGVPIRAIPNVCYQNYLPHKNGIHGQWIRPEDLKIYEKYISVIEFEDCDQAKEQALYRIYIEDKEWPGDFDMLYTNFNYKGVNRLLDNELGKIRMNCGQRCEMNNSCQLCDINVELADPDKWLQPND